MTPIPAAVVGGLWRPLDHKVPRQNIAVVAVQVEIRRRIFGNLFQFLTQAQRCCLGGRAPGASGEVLVRSHDGAVDTIVAQDLVLWDEAVVGGHAAATSYSAGSCFHTALDQRHVILSHPVRSPSACFWIAAWQRGHLRMPRRFRLLRHSASVAPCLGPNPKFPPARLPGKLESDTSEVAQCPALQLRAHAAFASAVEGRMTPTASSHWGSGFPYFDWATGQTVRRT
eukprot:CAMPEP_0180784768 /NCGR_PEP_ID=MMETSP1038_2-20121128/49794_1 /TAXON_ID=632150 /ORGANISM="Azadinium spinosum, Strain 3D9" /LENGTH=226 /DNA_ID=CAMNT_0022821547 /DNA_START=158 /DNA_END=839 /DNA_ORIENTATION=-